MPDLRTADPTMIASEFVRAAADGDRDALRSLLAPDVAFRALTPSRSWEHDSADDAVETMIGRWFGGDRRIDAVESMVIEPIGDVVRVGYRFGAMTATGRAVVEQQAYLELDGGRIRAARVVCSGYHPVAG